MLSNKESKERDMKVVEFISNFPCYSDTIAKMYYPSLRMANYHLYYLTDYGYIKRDRKYGHEKYFYYTGKLRSRKEHYDIIAKTYNWILKNDYEVIDVKVQQRQDSIEPDMIVQIKQGNSKGIIAVEVERANKNIQNTIKKYEGTTFDSVLMVSHLPTDYIENEYIKVLYNINFNIFSDNSPTP